MAFFEAKGLRSLPQVLLNGVQLDLEEVREGGREGETVEVQQLTCVAVGVVWLLGPGGSHCEPVAAANVPPTEMGVHGELCVVALALKISVCLSFSLLSCSSLSLFLFVLSDSAFLPIIIILLCCVWSNYLSLSALAEEGHGLN